MRSSRALSVAAVAALASLTTSPAHAEPTAADRAVAQTLFGEGRTLMTAGRTTEACTKFAESDRLDPEIGTHLNLGLCHEALGQTATAWVELSEVADRAARARDAERSTFAQQHADALARKLSRVRLRVASPDPAQSVSVDGRPIGKAAWGEAFPLDPGSHPVEASAPGKVTWRSAVTVLPGPATLDVDVPALSSAAAVAAPSAAPGAAETPPVSTVPAPPAGHPPTVEDAPRAGGQKTLGFVVGSIGVAGLAAGSVFGVMTLARNATAKSDCTLPDGNCPTSAGVNASKDASTYATISDVAFGVGLAGVAAGVILVLTAHPSPPAGLQVVPVVGRSGGGLDLRCAW